MQGTLEASLRATSLAYFASKRVYLTAPGHSRALKTRHERVLVAVANADDQHLLALRDVLQGSHGERTVGPKHVDPARTKRVRQAKSKDCERHIVRMVCNVSHKTDAGLRQNTRYRQLDVCHMRWMGHTLHGKTVGQDPFLVCRQVEEDVCEGLHTASRNSGSVHGRVSCFK